MNWQEQVVLVTGGTGSFGQRFIDRLLPFGHFMPLAGHLPIARLDLRIRDSGRGALALIPLPPIDIGPAPHDASSGSAPRRDGERIHEVARGRWNHRVLMHRRVCPTLRGRHWIAGGVPDSEGEPGSRSMIYSGKICFSTCIKA